MNNAAALLVELQRLADPKRVEAMTKFAVGGKRTLGVSMPEIRRLAKREKRDHRIAQALWKSGFHEARILASLVAEPASVTAKEMDKWAREFDSWDVCDQVCLNLFWKTPFALEKASEWSASTKEFHKRAAFALMACLAVHAKKVPDEQFLPFFAIIKRESVDDRNFVIKAANWALRQIGKRSTSLHKEAVKTAKEIAAYDSRGARWLAADVLRELTNESTKRKVASRHMSRSKRVNKQQ